MGIRIPNRQTVGKKRKRFIILPFLTAIIMLWTIFPSLIKKEVAIEESANSLFRKNILEVENLGADIIFYEDKVGRILVKIDTRKNFRKDGTL